MVLFNLAVLALVAWIAYDFGYWKGYGYGIKARK